MLSFTAACQRGERIGARLRILSLFGWFVLCRHHIHGLVEPLALHARIRIEGKAQLLGCDLSKIDRIVVVRQNVRRLQINAVILAELAPRHETDGEGFGNCIVEGFTRDDTDLRHARGKPAFRQHAVSLALRQTKTTGQAGQPGQVEALREGCAFRHIGCDLLLDRHLGQATKRKATGEFRRMRHQEPSFERAETWVIVITWRGSAFLATIRPHETGPVVDRKGVIGHPSCSKIARDHARAAPSGTTAGGPMPQTKRFPGLRRLAAVATIAGTLPIAGCGLFGPIPQARGSLIEKADYAQLVPGTSRRSDVMDLLGSPTARATFDDNTWIYVSMITAPRPLEFPAVRKQDVVVLTFDNDGVLRKVATLDKSKGYDVGMVNQTTPTPGTKINILQQILGNVGKYNPMSNMGSTFGGSQGPLGSGQGTGQGGVGNSLP